MASTSGRVAGVSFKQLRICTLTAANVLAILKSIYCYNLWCRMLFFSWTCQAQSKEAGRPQRQIPAKACSHQQCISGD